MGNCMEKFIEINRANKNIPYSMKKQHYHLYTELYCLLSGEVGYFISGKIYKASDGDIVIVPKGELHKTVYRSDKRVERINIFFGDEALMPELLPVFSESKVLKNCGQEIKEMILSLSDEYAQQNAYREQSLICRLNLLALTLARSPGLNRESPQLSGKTEKTIIEAVKYMENHCGEDISLSAVAGKFGLSPGYFSKRFVKVTGFNFSKYLTQLRIRKAERMMIEKPDMKITGIAMECGFSDPVYFISVFRKIKGTAPGKWKKQF